MIRDLLTVLRTELRLQLRQPLALVLLLVLPVVLGPGMAAASTWYTTTLGVTHSAETETDPLPVTVPAEVVPWLQPTDHLELVDRDAALAELVVADGKATVKFDPSPRATEASRRLKAAVARHEREVTRQVLRDAGVEGELLRVTVNDQAGPALGPTAAVVPMSLLMLVLMTAAGVALDLLTGERERKTLETLLTTRVDRAAVAAAKIGLVVAESTIAGLAGVACTWAAQASGLVALEGFDAARWLGLAVAVVAVAAESAALMVVVAALSPSFRSASFLIGPVSLVAVGMAAVGALPVHLGPLGTLLPMANLGIVVRDASAGLVSTGTLAATAAATVGHLALAGAFVLWLGNREATLFASPDTASSRRAGFYGRDAAWLWVGQMAALWYVGQTAQAIDLVGGTIVTLPGLFAGGTLLYVTFLGLPLKPTLSLGAPGWRNLALGLALGCVTPLVALAVGALQSALLPVPLELFAELEDAFANQPIALSLLLFAVFPGVCEELLFRGAILGLTRRSLPVVPRVLINAAAFGAMHVSLHRFGPTGAIGLVLAILTVRTGTLWPAVLAHTTNNALAILAGRAGYDLGALVWVSPLGIVAAAALLTRARPPP